MDLKYYASRKKKCSNKKKIVWKYKKLLSYIKKNEKFLDVGCANCELGLFLKKKVDYYGVDYNSYFIDVCKKKQLKVYKCDVSKEKLPFKDNFFDIIYVSHVLEHLNTEQQIYFSEELARVIKKNGIIFIFSPTPYHWYFWDDETHVRPCTHGQLSKLFKNFNFEVIESKYSKLRFFSNRMQKYLRLPPIRFFLWEVYVILKKK